LNFKIFREHSREIIGFNNDRNHLEVVEDLDNSADS